VGTVVKKKKSLAFGTGVGIGKLQTITTQKDSIYSLVKYVGSVFLVYILNSVAVQESKLHPACFLHTQ